MNFIGGDPHFTLVNRLFKISFHLTVSAILFVLLSSCVATGSGFKAGDTLNINKNFEGCSGLEGSCSRTWNDFKFVYEIVHLSGTQYRLQGHVQFLGSRIYESSDPLHITFVTGKDQIVLDVLNVWVSGDLGNKLEFEKTFASEKRPDYAFVVAYSGTIRE